MRQSYEPPHKHECVPQHSLSGMLKEKKVDTTQLGLKKKVGGT